MKKKIPSVLVSVCNPAKQLLPMWIWIISDVSWLQTDSWKWKILRCERLAVGINASKVAVNVKHQSPEYRPSEIFRPLVSKLANWHPRSCNATVSRKTESYSSRSLSLRREIHLRVWSKVYSLLLTWTRRLHQATLWHSLSLKCVSLSHRCTLPRRINDLIRTHSCAAYAQTFTLWVPGHMRDSCFGDHICTQFNRGTRTQHSLGGCWWKLSVSGQRVWCSFSNSYQNSGGTWIEFFSISNWKTIH